MASDKSKWKMFRKKEPTPVYPVILKPRTGCPCGNAAPCKQRITPRGVTIHYPQKKKKPFNKFPANKQCVLSAKPDRGYNKNPRPTTKVKVIRQRKFPSWGLDRIYR